MCLLPKVPELDLELISGKDDGLVHGDGMGSIQDGQLGLLVQQVQLDGVPVVNVGVAVKVLPLQEQDVVIHDPLLAESLAMVHPVHCKENDLYFLCDVITQMTYLSGFFSELTELSRY